MTDTAAVGRPSPATADVQDTPAVDSLDDQEIEAEVEGAEPGCPICRFIEAGACGEEHKVWVACRQEAKEAEVDFVKQCADTFRSFFGCMLSHQDYYQPFLEAFEVDVPRSQQALDWAKQHNQQQQPEPPQQPQQKDTQMLQSNGLTVQQQQQQQQPPPARQPEQVKQEQQQGAGATGVDGSGGRL